jgi:hypothetical protein
LFIIKVQRFQYHLLVDLHFPRNQTAQEYCI